MSVFLNDAAVSSDAATSSWIRTPYGVQLSENPANSFKTYMEVEKFVMAQDGTTEETSAGVAEWMNIMEDNSLGNSTMNRDGLADGNVFYSKPNYTDTRVGGNDVINPYWQFNRDDDIVPPLLAMKLLRGSDSDGMGRVYNEVYDSNQQILWMSMGVPEYVNLVSFYRDAGNINASRAMARGTLRGIVGTIIKMVFSATIWAITFPVCAPFWAHRFLTRIETERICKYCYFKPAMVIYYEMVNTMLSYLAVGMGLYPQVILRRSDSSKVLDAQYAQMQGEPDPVQDTLKVGAAITETPSFNVPVNVGQTYADNITQGGQSEYIPEPTPQKVADTPGRSQETIKDNLSVTNAINKNNPTQPEGPLYGKDLPTSETGSVTTNADGTQAEADTTGAVQTIVDDNAKKLQQGNVEDSGIPEILKNGPDIFAIINRRALLFNANRFKLTTRMLMTEMKTADQNTGNNHWTSPNVKYQTDENGNVTTVADSGDVEKTGAWANTWASLKSNVLGAGDYVGFRIERGVSTSESISNSTGPTGIAQTLNNYAQAQKAKYEDYGNSWTAKTLGEFRKGPLSAISNIGKELAANVASAIGIGDIGAVMTQGNGFLDLPDVWKGSTFSRSYSFSIPLRARYGDPVSIYQSIYIPLCMLLAAAMPRSVGSSMYTSPFMIKAYCKGMFSIPFGLIDNLSISRGKDEFGWSNVMLPTAVDVSVSIKDMTPTFFLSMQDIGLFDTFSNNDNFLEYLDTFSALGITERLCYFPKAIRKLSAAMLIKRNTVFNSNYWGVRLGRNTYARAIASVAPFANYEKTDFAANIPGTVFK